MTQYYRRDGYGMAPGEVAYAVADLPETPNGFSGGGAWGYLPPAAGTMFNPLRHVRLHGTHTVLR